MRFTPIEFHEVYRVSRRTRTCSYNHFDELLRLCTVLPIGYAEFLKEFGIGYLDDIQIFDLPEVLAYSNSIRESLKEWFALCCDSGVEPAIGEEFCENAVMLAKTGWGDSYFCSPSNPGVLWYLSRPQDWDNYVDRVPLGFSNPFVHLGLHGDLTSFGMEDLVFTPSNPRASFTWVAPRKVTQIELSECTRFVDQCYTFDKRTQTLHRVSYYAQSLSLVLDCSFVENGILFLFEFEEDYHLEVKQLLEKIAGRGVCGER